MKQNTRILSWNVNEGVYHKTPVVEELYRRINILYIQEYLLTNDGLSLLKLSDNHTFNFVPVKSRQRGKPPGGLAIVNSSALDFESLHAAKCT